MSNLLITGAGLSNFCAKASEIVGIVGWVLTVIKIGIPLIIIALGLLDLGKAAVSSKPEEIKKVATGLVWRFVGGIAIFFIPTLVMLIFGLIGNKFDETKQQTDYNICYTCITSPWSCPAPIDPTA